MYVIRNAKDGGFMCCKECGEILSFYHKTEAYSHIATFIDENNRDKKKIPLKMSDFIVCKIERTVNIKIIKVYPSYQG